MEDSDYFDSIYEDSDTSGFSVNEEDLDIDYRTRQNLQHRQQLRPKKKKRQAPQRERAAIVQRLRSGSIKPEPYWAREIAEFNGAKVTATLETSIASETSLQLDTSTSHIASPPLPAHHVVAIHLKRSRPENEDSMNPDIDTDTMFWTEERLNKKRRFERDMTPAMVLGRWSWIRRVCSAHSNLFAFPSCAEGEQVDVFYRYIYWNILVAVNHIIINTSRILSYYQRYDDANGIERLYNLSEARTLLPSNVELSLSSNTTIPQLDALVKTLSGPLLTAMSLFHRKHSVLIPYIVSLALRCDELAAHMNSLHVIFVLSHHPMIHPMPDE